jgi:serine/threonine protein kinase
MGKTLFDQSLINVSGQSFRLSDSTFIGSGGEAEVHKIDDVRAVKIYKDMARAERLKDKLTILCEKATSFHESVVSPKELAFIKDGSKQSLCGFSMSLISNSHNLEDYVWNDEITPENETRFDTNTANLIYDIATGLRAIHKSYVVLGDLKPENILVSNGKAYIVDFDSASLVPDFPGELYTDFYVDPRLRGNSPDKKVAYSFDAEADWWSLGVIAFELFFGILPWGGQHPKLRSDKVLRACHYSAVGFDTDVKAINMRPFSWLNSKPQLREFFRNLFSPAVSYRFSIEFALERYFPRPQAKRETFVIPKADRPSSAILPDLVFSNELVKFTENVTSSIKDKARAVRIKRGERLGVSDPFLEYMLGLN